VTDADYDADAGELERDGYGSDFGSAKGKGYDYFDNVGCCDGSGYCCDVLEDGRGGSWGQGWGDHDGGLCEGDGDGYGSPYANHYCWGHGSGDGSGDDDPKEEEQEA